MRMIELDGSRGEGGGQVLRSSLTLSLATGRDMRIHNIRAKRPKPGLRAQHLQAVRAAAEIGNAEVEGDTMGSQSVTFRPGEITAGSFHFKIGTAGATTLVLQSIFIPLSMAEAISEVVITGGTHVKWSPCFHYLDWHWLTYLRQLGYHADMTLEAAGFYPRGGGRLRARIRPMGPLSPIRLVHRGDLVHIQGLSAVSNLPISIAERQRRQTRRRLAGMGCPHEVVIQNIPSTNKGTLLILLARFEHSQVCYFGLGERGKPAELVADEAVDALDAFLATDGAVDEYLADQMLLPLALAPGDSVFRTSKVTRHLLTNAEVIRAFTPTQIEVDGGLGEPGTIRINPPG